MWITMWIALAVIVLWTLFPLFPLLLIALGVRIGNEGESSLAVLPWMFMITGPTGIVAGIIWAGLALYFWLYR